MGCGGSVCAAHDDVRPAPGPPEPRIMKAQALYQQQRTAEALRELDEAIFEWPECARAYVERGRIKAENSQLESAVADFNAAIKCQPDYLMALHMRSHAHLQLGHLEEATADYARAIKLDPDNGQLRALKTKIKKAVDDRKGGAAGPGPGTAGTRAAGTAGAGGSGAGSAGGSTIRPNPMMLEPSTSFHSVVNGAPRISASPRNADPDDPFSGLDTPTSTRGGGPAGRRKLCMVCMDRDRGCRLRPCLHAALCVECAEGLRARHYTCPICSMRIESVEAGTFAQTFTTEEIAGSGMAALAAGLRMVGAATTPTGATAAGSGAGMMALAISGTPTTPSGLRSARAGPSVTGMALPQLAEEGEADTDEAGEGGGAEGVEGVGPSISGRPSVGTVAESGLETGTNTSSMDGTFGSVVSMATTATTATGVTGATATTLS